MSGEIRALLAMVNDLQQRVPLEEMLQRIVDRTAAMIGVSRVSLRLFDDSRSRLLAVCRAGEPHHQSPTTEFRLGEGLVGWIAQQGQSIRTGDADHDPRFVTRADLKAAIGSYLGVPLSVDRACVGVLSATDPTADRFTEEDEELLGLIAGICAPHIEIVRRARLEQIDEVTGVLNRRALDLAIPELSLITVAALEIDGFARIGDAHGVLAADEALKRVAKLLAGVLRAGDSLVRLGGSEFLYVYPATDLERGVAIAEEAARRVQASGIAAGGATARFTLSVGVATRRADEPRESLVARAEATLAAAKRRGGNCVERERPAT